MTNDTRSTIIGLVGACLIQGLTYMQVGVDTGNPVWWAGLAGSCASAIKGYLHNREKPLNGDEGPMIHPKPPVEEGPFIHPKPPEG